MHETRPRRASKGDEPTAEPTRLSPEQIAFAELLGRLLAERWILGESERGADRHTRPPARRGQA